MSMSDGNGGEVTTAAPVTTQASASASGKISFKQAGMEEVCATFETKIGRTSEILNTVNNIRKSLLEDDLVWYGTARDTIAESFKNFSDTFESEITKLTTYKEFINTTIADYQLAEDTSVQSMEADSTNLGVTSTKAGPLPGTMPIPTPE